MNTNDSTPRKTKLPRQPSEPVTDFADRARLEEEFARVAAERDRLAERVHRLEAENLSLKQKVDELARLLFGRRSEKVDRTDLEKAAENSADPEPAEPPPFLDESPDVEEPEKTAKKKRKGKRNGRRPLPATLPRTREVHELPAEELGCPCCGRIRTPFGEDVTEILEFVPASFRVIEHARLKYRCEDCEGQIASPPLPPMPIEKGRPGQGLLAHVITAKYCDHLPLNRLTGIMRREGIEIQRSTLCDWVFDTARLLSPIRDEIARCVLLRKVVGMDETSVLVRDREAKRGIRRGHLWVYRGEPGEVVFEHTATKSGEGPARFLKGYSGFVQADAANGFDRLFKTGERTEVGCWAHSRRKFYKAKDAFPTEAGWALTAIGRLYDVEREAKESGFDHAERGKLRQARSRRIVDGFFAWLHQLKPTLIEKSLLFKAVQYALNQEAALRCYLEDGRLSIDNNDVERAIRHVAVGRKAWLFAGSANAAEIGAILYSLVVSCKEIGLDPWAYLRDVISRVFTQPARSIGELTPRGWKAARGDPPTT